MNLAGVMHNGRTPLRDLNYISRRYRRWGRLVNSYNLEPEQIKSWKHARAWHSSSSDPDNAEQPDVKPAHTQSDQFSCTRPNQISCYCFKLYIVVPSIPILPFIIWFLSYLDILDLNIASVSTDFCSFLMVSMFQHHLKSYIYSYVLKFSLFNRFFTVLNAFKYDVAFWMVQNSQT